MVNDYYEPPFGRILPQTSTIEPENHLFEKEHRLPMSSKPLFWGSMLVFWEIMFWNFSQASEASQIQVFQPKIPLLRQSNGDIHGVETTKGHTWYSKQPVLNGWKW